MGVVHRRRFVVSTHSRPKAAATSTLWTLKFYNVSTHSRPKAAARLRIFAVQPWCVSTHSRPKAAARHACDRHPAFAVSTHSRPKAAAWGRCKRIGRATGFNSQPPEGGCGKFDGVEVIREVSTHSRPKAAAYHLDHHFFFFAVSTHSRPKAAASRHGVTVVAILTFQLTAARRRLPPLILGT